MTTDVETFQNRRFLARAIVEAPFSPSSISNFLNLLSFIDARAGSVWGQDSSLPRTWREIMDSVMSVSVHSSGHGLPAWLLEQRADDLRASVHPDDVSALLEYARLCRAWSHGFDAHHQNSPRKTSFSKPLLTSLKQGDEATWPAVLPERRAQEGDAGRGDRRAPAGRSAALIERRRRAFMLGQSDLNALEAILTTPLRRTSTAPLCPLCGEPLMTRRAQRGINAGRRFIRCGATGCAYTRTA